MSSSDPRGGHAARRYVSSLRGRAVLAFTLSAGVVALLLSLSVYSIGNGYMQDQRMRSADRLATAHAELLRPRLNDTPDGVALASIEPPDETILVLRTGNDWYDTDPMYEPVGLLPAALIKKPTLGIERVTLGSVSYLRVGVPLDNGDVLYEFTAITELESNLRMLRRLLTGGTIAATIIGAALGVWASRRVLTPLGEVASAAERIASGELELRLRRTRDRDLSTTVDSFNTMVDSLQQRIDRERRLVGDLSHELRTPLTTLVTSASVLNKNSGEMSERARRALEFLTDELEHLRHMLDDMLELARVEAGVHRGDTEVLSAKELLAQTLAGRKYAPELLTAPEDAQISGRKLELERAIGNLLANADRHGGGVIGVGLGRSGTDVLISVDDAGPGVPQADRSRIFERFATVGAVRRKAVGSGTGIGLALVSETVLAHRGRVECTERPGGGARFVITLPEAEEP